MSADAPSRTSRTSRSASVPWTTTVRFRDAYGCGPARAFELVHLARAALALQRSNLSLAQIAAEYGLSSPYHCSHRFAATYKDTAGRLPAHPVRGRRDVARATGRPAAAGAPAAVSVPERNTQCLPAQPAPRR
ncbi:helix-turn-helix domain-containing protein [Streptomyces ambofaciens]|uniref:helix-turn-helix domain-containing protein n=1 Tax=Streptomyces ambofaciens TaxID=1889 RepID=UPI000D1788F4